MTTSYIPITVNLHPNDAPAGINGTDYYTSGLSIQNQANAMLAAGAPTTQVNDFASNALQNLSQNGQNSAYFTPAAGNVTDPTAPTSPSWMSTAYNSAYDAIKHTFNPASALTDAASSVTGVNLFSGWNLSRVLTIIIGLLLLLGSLIMFSTDKESVTNIIQSVAKNPELLAE